LKLYSFINDHLEEILAEWEAFAETQEPAASSMSKLALRDHAKEILNAVALDMKTAQNPQEQLEKSQGNAPDAVNPRSAASIHGALRHASHFSLLQLSAEYRALRATVLRLWLPYIDAMSGATINEMIRFNEAIDQALAESIITYSARDDRTRDLFLAILGHDLRAPLSTISMAGELLTRAVTEDQVPGIGASIKRSAHLMGSMVEDLIGFTRTQLGGGMPVTRTQVDVGTICSSAIEDASASHAGRKFELRTEGDVNGFFDGVRLHQLLTNLFINAALYGEKERPVIVDARGDAGGVTVSVTNFGATIPEASMQSIFQPLVQLPAEPGSETRPRTSLGLGLFIAREIAIAHDGAINVTSNEIDGTTFTVRLPRIARDSTN
jgi:signal transduction histidine kinase